MTSLYWPVSLVLTVIASIIAYWEYWRWSHRRLLKLAAMVPGPNTFPGLVFLMHPDEILDTILRYFMTHGEYFKFWIGPKLNIAVRNPADIKLLLTSSKVVQKGYIYDSLKPTGPRGSNWKNCSKMVTNRNNEITMKQYTKVFNAEARILVKTLTEKNFESFNIHDDILRSTTQTVCQTLIGLSKEDSLTVNRIEEIMKTLPEIYELIYNITMKWWYRIPIIHSMIETKKQEAFSLNLIDEMTSDLVGKRRRALQNEEEGYESLGAIDKYIMSKELTELEMKWMVMNILLTSQESVSRITSGVLLFLAHMPDWQEKVYNEIINELEHKNKDLTDKEVENLMNLDLVYKEALRYFSTAILQRTIKEELTSNDGAITLPIGASMIIPIYQLHRDAQYWYEPNKVDPGRFRPEICERSDPNAFVPFSEQIDGFDASYQSALVKITVVHLIRQFHFMADGSLQDLEVRVDIAVRPAKGYNLRLRQRNVV